MPTSQRPLRAGRMDKSQATTMRLVLIEWVDSFGCSSDWQELAESRQPEPMVCKSVGWLFYDGSQCKVIVPHVADTPNGAPKQGCGDMTIPTESIRRISDLHEPAREETA